MLVRQLKLLDVCKVVLLTSVDLNIFISAEGQDSVFS